MNRSLSSQVHRSLTEVNADIWNAQLGHHDPFLNWSFLAGLEKSGCTTQKSGWQPAHISLLRDNTSLATLPAYLKSHSYGEYVFDWSWADAWQRMGLAYYPKLVTAIPFTPATGSRIWCNEELGISLETVTHAVQSICDSLSLSSWHVLFLEEAQSTELAKHGMPQRLTTQFHWFNHNYRDFHDFLDQFSSRKRKNLRRERDHIQRQGLELRTLRGDQISASDWDFFYRCYQTTYAKRSGHGGYLKESFFTETCPTLGDTPVMVIAYREDHPVAAALFFQGKNTLYGRYWGCISEFDYLHFEACYYQGIEYCIEQGLSRFDPGAQGEHKIQRGFEPVLTFSNHWIADDRLRTAVASFANQECEHVRAYQREAKTLLPFKQDTH